MLFSKINMVYNQYKKHQNEQGGICCLEQLLEILSVLFTNGTISKQRTFLYFGRTAFLQMTRL